MWQVFVFIINLQIDHQQLGESVPHFLTITQRKVAKDKVETSLKVWRLGHNVFKGSNGIIVLAQFYKGDANVLHDLSPMQTKLIMEEMIINTNY